MDQWCKQSEDYLIALHDDAHSAPNVAAVPTFLVSSLLLDVLQFAPQHLGPHEAHRSHDKECLVVAGTVPEDLL